MTSAIIGWLALSATAAEISNCGYEKIRVFGTQKYQGLTAKATMKSLGHFNGIYELESEETNGRPVWTRQRPENRTVSIEWTENIYGKPAWILTNHPGQLRFVHFSEEDCPDRLITWQLLENGNRTDSQLIKPAPEVKLVPMLEARPVPRWVEAQLDDNTELEEADFEVSDIFTMLAHFAPQKHFKLHTYACSSLSDKRIFMTPQGGADLVLEAVNNWKRCVTCAQEVFGATADPYKFDKTAKSCTNTSGNIEKSLCECDLEFAKTIRPMKIPNRPLTESECTLVSQSRRQKCCFNQKKNLFKIYNSDISCCSDVGTIESLGTC